jgi:hypothetical protein
MLLTATSEDGAGCVGEVTELTFQFSSLWLPRPSTWVGQSTAANWARLVDEIRAEPTARNRSRCACSSTYFGRIRRDQTSLRFDLDA